MKQIKNSYFVILNMKLSFTYIKLDNSSGKDTIINMYSQYNNFHIFLLCLGPHQIGFTDYV